MKRKFNKFQIFSFTLLWVVLCYLVLMTAERIDGPVILTILFSGALVFIPLFKNFGKK